MHLLGRCANDRSRVFCVWIAFDGFRIEIKLNCIWKENCSFEQSSRRRGEHAQDQSTSDPKIICILMLRIIPIELLRFAFHWSWQLHIRSTRTLVQRMAFRTATTSRRTTRQNRNTQNKYKSSFGTIAMAEIDAIIPDKVSKSTNSKWLSIEFDGKGNREQNSHGISHPKREKCSALCSENSMALFLQDEIADLKAAKDTSHSALEDLDTEDLYVKLKVSWISKGILPNRDVNGTTNLT